VSRWLPLALLLASSGAAAQEGLAAHMEGCLVWNREGPVMVRNDCSRPVALLFMDFDEQQVVSADLPPGARFAAPSRWGQSRGFMYTACPVGYRPSLRFALENKEPIGASLYNCVGGRPTS
jgi:hypothetical protein